MPQPWDDATLMEFQRAPTPALAHALAATDDDRALRPLVEASTNYMEGPYAGDLREAMRALATVDRLARWLDGDVEQKRVAAHALTARYEAHVPLIAKAIRDDDAQVRAIARRSLRSWTRSDALHALLLDLLGHDDPRVRAIAADGLGAMAVADDVTTVQAAIEREVDERARHALDQCLARLEG